MATPRPHDKKRRIRFYLRAKTSAGAIRLPCVHEEIADGCLRVSFDWIVFEKVLSLHSIQPFAEVRTKAGVIVDYELDEETPVGKGNKVCWMPARKAAHFTSTVPLLFILDLDPAFTA